MSADHANSDKFDLGSTEHLRPASELAVYSRNDRITYSLLIALSAITLAIARTLRPSANGYGTHQQLGLPPCAFFKLTSIPCPSCGLTTSFAHAARLHLYQAFITQPFGLVAFGLTVLGIPLCILLMQRQIAWKDAIHARGVDVVLYLLLAAYLLSWVYKIAMVKMQAFGS